MVHLEIIGFVVGTLLTEFALVLDTIPNGTPPKRVRSLLPVICLWIGSFLLLLAPLLLIINRSLHSQTTIWWLFGAAGLVVALLAVRKFVAEDSPTGPEQLTHRGHIFLASCWTAWGVLASALLAEIYRFLPLISLATATLAILGLILAIVSHVKVPDPKLLLRLPIALVAVLTLVGFGAAFVGHSTTLQIELGVNQQPVLATATQGAPGILDIRGLRAGILTSGLGQSDRVLQLDFHGYLRVSKPNFHQLVTLTIHGRFGDSKTQSLLFRARGVPQPGGSLDVTSSSLILRSHSPHLVAQGHADAVLSDAIFGTLRLHRRYYTYLLTYEPTGLYVLTGTISFWPQSAKLGHAALE